MIGFLWRKIWKNKWLMLCLIFGNIILIGMVAVVPLFTTATTQRLFQGEFRHVQETRNIFPAIMQLRYNFTAVGEDQRFGGYLLAREILWPEAIEDLGIPDVFGMHTYAMNNLLIRPAVARAYPNRDRTISLVAPEGFRDNINLVYGRMPADELVDGFIIEVLAMNSTLHRHNLVYGELLEVHGAVNVRAEHQHVRDREVRYGVRDARAGNPDYIHVMVVGIFELAEDAETYWSAVPITFANSMLFSDNLMSREFIEDFDSEYYMMHVTWTQVLDAEAMRANRAEHYVQTINDARDRFNTGNNIWHYSVNFYDIISQFAGGPDQLEVTVLVLQIPIYVMLALFMYMVTRQILLLDSNDISVLKSRGASRRQIMGVYALQGLFVGAVSFPFGIMLGVGLCHLIGSSSGFLEMVNRAALDVEITGQAILFGAIGMGISYLYLLLPVIGLSKVAIVDHKRAKVRKTQKPVWQKYFIDILTLALAIYLLYSFNLQREQMMITMPEARVFDPLLFAGSSLFIIGTALILLRLYPYLLKLVLIIGRRRFGPALYTSVVKVSRSAGGEQFIMLFLVFTVAVGIFSAQAARTLNLNNAHRIQYLGGADLMLREFWPDNQFTAVELELGAGPQPPIAFVEPDFNRFTHFEEVDAITPVLVSPDASVRMGVGFGVDRITLMGIETNTFGETVWFRDDLLSIHINHFLNILSRHPDGVLLSSNFSNLGYSIGDEVLISTARTHGNPHTGRFTIVGFIDHWPSFNPVSVTRLSTGEIRQEAQFLAVANLGQLRMNWGAIPYQIWMRTNGASHQFIHDFIREDGLTVSAFNDTVGTLVEILSDPIVQSTNGMLTIVFIMTMLLCFTGFLIYWILSIKGRLLQFGVFRAMGMGMRGIMSILISEQGLITISALIIGGVIGGVASRLFVPLVQLSYTAADQVIPLLVAMEPRDYMMIYGICGFMLVLCVTILVRYTLRVNVSQVLKLGED
ncbi:MAG: FtsX-like permease family protein [Oscillospiraceae bacterium]|nr:FtsX-like permease family protein [Oscillospiraceae bacterium]